MADRRDPTQKVPYSAPPEAYVFGYRLILSDAISKRGMYVFSPLDVIPVGWIAKVRIESEMKVVMRVDQPWHNQKAAQVDVYALGCSRERPSSITSYRCKPPVSHFDGASHTIVRANGTTGSVE
jgi:hypothetical protein